MVSKVSIFSSTGLRSGGGGGQPNSNTGARPSAPFRSNVYQPTEMTMILNGGAVSTSGQSQVHAALSFQDADNHACTSVRCCPCHCTRVRERCECAHYRRVCMSDFVYPVGFCVSPRANVHRSVQWRRLLVHHHRRFAETTRCHTPAAPEMLN